jgi:hypothetical protein
MDEPHFVDARAFAATLCFLMRFHQSSMDHFSALLKSLIEKKVLTQEEWSASLRMLRETEESKASWRKIEDVEKILETQSVADMLRDFSGPIQ